MRAEGESSFTREDLDKLWRILSPDERLEGFRLLPPDDAADLIQHVPEAEREGLLA